MRLITINQGARWFWIQRQERYEIRQGSNALSKIDDQQRLKLSPPNED